MTITTAAPTVTTARTDGAAPAAFAEAKKEFSNRLLRMEPRGGAAPAEIIKEELSEYFLYTVEGRDTIPNGWSKRLPSFKAADVPITSFYKYEHEQWNDRVMRYYRFTNSTPSTLGNALKISEDAGSSICASTSLRPLPRSSRISACSAPSRSR